VTLVTNAPTGGAVVTLASTSPLVTVPASVTVAAGPRAKTFAATTLPVASEQTVIVNATQGYVTMPATLVLQPPTVQSLVLDPAVVPVGGASTGTVTLAAPAPAGGVTFQVISCNWFASQPNVDYLTIPAGETMGTFTAWTFEPTAPGAVTYQVGTATAELTITP
jgi:hypothetical protein